MAGGSEKAARIKSVFQKYDRNGDGAITQQELGVVLKSLGNFKDAEINTVFAHIDKNGDGKVQFSEFVDWVSAFGSPVDARAKVVLAPSSEDSDLRVIFLNFCDPGHADMDGRSFTKLCKDVRLIDKRLSPIDTDLIFSKVVTKGKRRISLAQFEAALRHISERKGAALDDVRKQVIDSSAKPVLHGTKAEAVRFHDDKSLYTGTHAGRPMAAFRGAELVPRSPSVPPLGVPGHSHGNQPHASGARSARGSLVGHEELLQLPRLAARSRPGTGSRSPPGTVGPLSARFADPRRSHTYKEVFRIFCNNHGDMDNKTFAKLCIDCGLLDSNFSATEIDLVFAKVCEKGQRRINMKQFEEAIYQIADRRGVDYGGLLEAIALTEGPTVHATQVEAVRFHDDKSTYTGTHSREGPDRPALGSGTSTQLASHSRRTSQSK